LIEAAWGRVTPALSAMAKPDIIPIDGHAHSWQETCELRRRQLEAWKATQSRQLTLFELERFPFFMNRGDSLWVGLAAKAGTPPAVIARLNAPIDKALREPKVVDALAKIGSETAGGTPEQLGDLVKSQVAFWGKVVKDAGLKLQ
jgi:tripartite-type tricarboxylate transporter receptor subunit TctC